MKADPFAQLKLLDVQAIDSQAHTLRHQRATLPEHAALEALVQRRVVADAAARDLQMDVDDLTRDQEKIDADVEQVKARRQRDQDRMDSGAIANPKDLAHMQDEMVSLQRRISTLEDEELEVMEALEAATAQLATHTGEVAAVDAEAAQLVAARDAKIADIDRQLTDLAADRVGMIDGLPADLLGLYDKLRESKGGVGAAMLRARECGGCRLTLDPAELATIRAASVDEVVRCEECQRILVRTDESGL